MTEESERRNNKSTFDIILSRFQVSTFVFLLNAKMIPHQITFKFAILCQWRTQRRILRSFRDVFWTQSKIFEEAFLLEHLAAK